MAGGARVGPATMIERLPLVIATKYNIPMLLDCEGAGHQVEGEVYKIDQRMLEHLDVLEAHPRLYSRRLHQIQVGGDTLSCWVYIVQGYKKEFLKLPHLSRYCTSKATFNMDYIADKDENDLYDEIKETA